MDSTHNANNHERDKAIFYAKLAAVRKYSENFIAKKSGANNSVVDDAVNAPTPIDVPTPRVYLTEKEREETITREYKELIIEVRKLPKLVGYKPPPSPDYDLMDSIIPKPTTMSVVDIESMVIKMKTDVDKMLARIDLIEDALRTNVTERIE